MLTSDWPTYLLRIWWEAEGERELGAREAKNKQKGATEERPGQATKGQSTQPLGITKKEGKEERSGGERVGGRHYVLPMQ